MRLKNERYRHIFSKDNYIRIHNTYIVERDKATQIKNIYDIVRNDYTNRLRDSRLNLKLERIYLNNKLDEYIGSTFDYWMKILFIVITVFITNSFNQALVQKNISALSVFIIFIILTALTIFMFIKNIKREVHEHTYYKICLTVLDELEKEESLI